ncbi:MAG TPA: hypothetical protein VKB96_02015 [Gammaproteobacteria bacterium]|nr:hypothetical protein [Gammaproteobacteria bacterium]
MLAADDINLQAPHSKTHKADSLSPFPTVTAEAPPPAARSSHGSVIGIAHRTTRLEVQEQGPLHLWAPGSGQALGRELIGMGCGSDEQGYSSDTSKYCFLRFSFIWIDTEAL